ncbi:MAG: MFS transporter [Gammaproteobacteria bacterium]|nr:MFS transporter [Gammaproteobacteria bacterium]MDH4254140.1 MFS transporter [Gammaproteobacteria bacterium]MDH5309493.1 MFS transporter [Gammaproteobacteria bacterium]
MPSFSRDPAVDRSLSHSLKDAAAFATMTGIGETYLSAFGIFLKASTPQIGLLASLPPMLASLVQLLSAWLGRMTGKRKAIVIAGASLQGLAWLPILGLPLLFPEHAVPLLIASVVIYHSGAHLAAPQWSSLMGDIVPARKRGRFFGLRTRIITAVTFGSLMVGGTVLHLSAGKDSTLLGFVALFSVACIARFVSVYHLGRMQDPSGHVAALELPVGHDWWQRLRESNAVRFSIFFAMMQFAVAIASPFFTVYMLRDLQFTYLHFTLNTGTAILAQFLTLSQWGRISDVFGNRRILAVTSLFIPLTPMLWTLSTNVWYLVALQALSGFSWAGFSLSAGNFIYDLISPQRRATYLAVHNILANVGIFSGAVLGGFLAIVMPTQFSVFGIGVTWLSSLYGVFIVSTMARALVALVLLPRLREVRSVRPISLSQVIFRVTRMNALAGLMFEIVGSRPKNDRQSGE